MPKNNNITNNLDLAIVLLQAGHLIAFPTETVYGLGADAKNPQAIANVFRLKGRPADHPVILHIAETAQLSLWAEQIPPCAYILANLFWPGPLTLILKKQAHVCDLITGGQDTIGIRIPNHPITLQLLKKFGTGIVGPSANLYGKVSPTCAQHVAHDLLDPNLLILDGGPCQVGIESTIVDVSVENPTIMRLGAITQQQIEDALGRSVQVATQKTTHVRTSGMHKMHYAPHTPSKLLPYAQMLQTAEEFIHADVSFSVLSFAKKPATLADNIVWQHLPQDPKNCAHDLYASLRKHDQLHNQYILIEMPPKKSTWAAIVDRLSRATCSA